MIKELYEKDLIMPFATEEEKKAYYREKKRQSRASLAAAGKKEKVNKEANYRACKKYKENNPDKAENLTIYLAGDIDVKDKFNNLVEITGLKPKDLLNWLMEQATKPKK